MYHHKARKHVANKAGKSIVKLHLQGTSLLQDLLELSTLLLSYSVISATNEFASNKHTRDRSPSCKLVEVVLDSVSVLPLIQLQAK